MSAINEIEIPDLPVVGPLLDRCFSEAGISDRVTKDECLSWVHGLIEGKKGKVYTDDIGNPTMLVCVGEGGCVFPREKPLVVFLVYVLPENRNGPTFRKMARLIEGLATAGGYNAVYASEWTYGSTPEIGTLWEAIGYKCQEKVYVKLFD